MFHISTHISPAIEPEIHPRAETPHANDDGTPHTSSLASVTPGTGFPSPGASGKPSGLLGNLSAPSSGFTPIKLPGDSTTYYIKNSSGNGPRTLYTGDPQAGTYKQSNKTVVSDGNHGWQQGGGLPGGGQKSSKQGDSGTPLIDQDALQRSSSSSWKSSPSSQSGSTQQSSSSSWKSSASSQPGSSQQSSSSSQSAGGGISKWYVTPDGRGGSKPASASADKEKGEPTHVFLRGPNAGKAIYYPPGTN